MHHQSFNGGTCAEVFHCKIFSLLAVAAAQSHTFFSGKASKNTSLGVGEIDAILSPMPVSGRRSMAMKHVADTSASCHSGSNNISIQAGDGSSCCSGPGTACGLINHWLNVAFMFDATVECIRYKYADCGMQFTLLKCKCEPYIQVQHGGSAWQALAYKAC